MLYQGLMKLVTCFLLLAWALPAQQAQQPQQSQSTQPPAPPETKPEDLCTVEGQVTSLATGAPVRKAEISCGSSNGLRRRHHARQLQRHGRRWR